jgi:hypothetical protein
VRVRKRKPSVSFPLMLAISIGAAFERNQRALGITQQQVHDLMGKAGEIIDDMIWERRAPAV